MNALLRIGELSRRAGVSPELGLIAFGFALRSHGWRIAYLGADTPLDTLECPAEAIAPAFLGDPPVPPRAGRALGAR
jgi:hypothetical protein